MKARALGLAVILATQAVADAPPHATFSSLDELPSDEVQAAIEDPHGFLWFATSEGLARFDGRSFRTFGREHGLGDPFLLTLEREDDGSLWVGAVGGVWRFDPRAGGRFERIPAHGAPPRWDVFAIAFDPRGTRWAASNDGLYRLVAGGTSFERASLGDGPGDEGRDAVVDRQGNLWYATTRSLRRLAADGTTAAIATAAIGDLLVDRDGRLWAAGEGGTCVVDDTAALAPRCRDVVQGLPAELYTGGLVEGADGRLWLGSRQGVFLLESRASRWVAYEPHHLRGEIDPLLVDRREGVWLAPRETGLERWSPGGIRAFGAEDGLERPHVWSIRREPSGDLLIVSAGHVLHRWDGERLTTARLRLPASLLRTGWGWGQTDFRDRDGRLWAATGEGLLRYPAVAQLDDLAQADPDAWWTEKDGLPGHDVFRLFEDSRGDLWLSLLDVGSSGNLVRRERATGRFETFGARDGLPAPSAPTAFAESRDGTMWIGFYTGELVRRRDGRFEIVPLPGDVHGSVPALLDDGDGHLWVGTSSGLFRCDVPSAERPDFRRYGIADGLASERIRAFARDASGRLFVATAKGIDVLEPATGAVIALSQRDGLPPGLAMALAFDGASMWYGTTRGLARLDPSRVTAARKPPAARIDVLRVGGTPRSLPAIGAPEVGDIELRADERLLHVETVVPTTDPAERLRLQYRIGPGAWSAPSEERSIVLAGVAPGPGRLEIRAVSAAGTPSEDVAVVRYRALAPWWRQRWFFASVALALGGAAALGYRARLNRLLGLERQRTQIAMDLHDEIGSGLGSIGLLADLGTDPAVAEARRRGLAEETGEIATELSAAMAEIVWSLRPGSETVEEFARHLVDRARRIFPGGGATLVASMPGTRLGERWSPAARRNAMLVALEALHNAAKHARATRVELRLEPLGRRWSLVVSDDGRGVEAIAPERDGMGLESMRRRAERIGAVLEVASEEGAGTTVRLVFDPRASEHGRLP